MTQQPQQLKFGDRVRCKQTGAEGLIIDTGKTAVWIIWEGQKCSNFYAYGTSNPSYTPTPPVSTGWPTPQTKSAASSYLPSAWSSTSTVCATR